MVTPVFIKLICIYGSIYLFRCTEHNANKSSMKIPVKGVEFVPNRVNDLFLSRKTRNLQKGTQAK